MVNKFLIASLFYVFHNAYAQVGLGTVNIDPSAVLELKSTTKGFLMPRMTTSERNLITTPVEGLMVYNTDRQAIQFYRKNVGSTGALFGWYDSKCDADVAAAISSLPTGLTLDFSDLTQNGQFFASDDGTGTAFDASTPDGTAFKSIGPIPMDITGAVAGNTYIKYSKGTGTGKEPSGLIVYKLTNKDAANNYNASTFATRELPFSGSNENEGHKMFANLTDYSGSFDIVIVAKFNVTPSNTNESFFNTGSGTTGLQLGGGVFSTSNPCSHKYFNMNFAEINNGFCGKPANNGGVDNRVKIDLNFHRFRIKYTDNGGSGNNIAEFSIDGKVIETRTGSNLNATKIENLELYTNRARKRFPASSIAFLGVYPSHLTPANFNALDKYLACKFESQP